MPDQHEPSQPKSSLRHGAEKSYVIDMEARLAVLEQISIDTKEVLVEMKRDIRDIRQDQKTDFRLLFGAVIAVALGLAGIMAHGFHWF